MWFWVDLGHVGSKMLLVLLQVLSLRRSESDIPQLRRSLFSLVVFELSLTAAQWDCLVLTAAQCLFSGFGDNLATAAQWGFGSPTAAQSHFSVVFS